MTSERGRSAITGRIVKVETAKKHPKTHVVEKVKPVGDKPKGKAGGKQK